MNTSDQLEILRSTPEIAGRFEIVRVLGHGTAGSVYLVRDRDRDNETIALKILMNEMAFDEHTAQRFKEEWAVCQKIIHPNLVKSYELLEYEKCLGFTMEYVPGCDLAKLIKQERMQYEEINRIMYQLLDAVRALHESNFMHRDIKLENIILRDDGVVKLGDLGLLKRTRAKTLTRPGLLLGTPQYMPPEYIKSGRFDTRSDVYACGVVMYELLTGQRRLDDKRGAAAITHLVKTNFEFPRIALTGVGRHYVKILERALAVNPNERFISAKEMQDAFNPSRLEEPDQYRLTQSVSFHFGGGRSNARRKTNRMMMMVLVLVISIAAVVAGSFLLALRG